MIFFSKGSQSKNSEDDKSPASPDLAALMTEGCHPTAEGIRSQQSVNALQQNMSRKSLIINENNLPENTDVGVESSRNCSTVSDLTSVAEVCCSPQEEVSSAPAIMSSSSSQVVKSSVDLTSAGIVLSLKIIWGIRFIDP